MRAYRAGKTVWGESDVAMASRQRYAVCSRVSLRLGTPKDGAHPRHRVVVRILWLVLGADLDERVDDGLGEVELGEPGLFELDRPKERVEGHDPELLVDGAVAAERDEELDERAHRRVQERGVEDEERLERVKDLFGRRLVPVDDHLIHDLELARDHGLE